MSKARLVITAVTLEKRPVSEVARSYGVSRSWLYELLARYEAEGEAAFEPRSRRPKASPSAAGPATVELITRLRKELAGQGLDAGPHTISWHLREHHRVSVSPATVSRYLARLGLVTPDPAKRPRSSYIRFEAEMPNECWQSDFTHYPLAGGRDAQVLTWPGDHSRYALSVTAHAPVTGADVLETFQGACARHGAPASTLTDNGAMSLMSVDRSREQQGRHWVAAGAWPARVRRAWVSASSIVWLRPEATCAAYSPGGSSAWARSMVRRSASLTAGQGVSPIRSRAAAVAPMSRAASCGCSPARASAVSAPRQRVRPSRWSRFW